MRQIQSVVFLLGSAIFLILMSGCSAYRPSQQFQYSEAPSGRLFLNGSQHSEIPAFFQEANSQESEKIRFLLNRIANSEGQFLRNGEWHDGKEARQWFLYKMQHWVSGVKTAKDFIERVASFSQKTGEPYLVQFHDGPVYSLSSVLKNELTAFENQQQAQFNGVVSQGVSPNTPPSLTPPPTSPARPH